MISGMDLKNDEKRPGFGLGSAFFGISDPGLVKKTFFKVFFHKKLTGGPGDEILEIFVLAAFLWWVPKNDFWYGFKNDGQGRNSASGVRFSESATPVW